MSNEEKTNETSIVLSREMDNFLKAQYEASYEELLSLISYDAKYPPSKAAVRRLVAMAMAYRLPVSALAFIPTRTGGHPYVKAEGVNWRLQLDPRGLKAMYAKPIKWPTKENNYRAVFKGVVEFNNGQRFTA